MRTTLIFGLVALLAFTVAGNLINLRQIDLFLIQDLTEPSISQIANLVCTISEIVTSFSALQCFPEIAGNYQRYSIDPRFGVGIFEDIPVSPFGWPNTPYSIPYETEIPLSEQFDASTIETTVKELSAHNGGDPKQSQLTALLAACAQSDIGWRQNSTKIIVLITWADYHAAGDYNMTANSGNGILYGTPLGVGQDYPSEQQVSNACNSRNISVIFLVAQELEPEYMTLAYNFFNSTVLSLSGDPSNLVTSFFQAVVNTVPACILNQTGSSSGGGSTVSFYVNCAEKTVCNVAKNSFGITIPSSILSGCDAVHNIAQVSVFVTLLMLIVVSFIEK